MGDTVTEGGEASDLDAPLTRDFPLRGLASDGAEARVGPPLRALPGVVAVAVLASEFRVRVTYDPAQIAPETIREALHGLVAPDTAHETGAS